jgi:hypothetical protein
MTVRPIVLFTSAMLLCPLMGQDREPVVSKDSVSVHKVERGDMPLKERAAGSITSLNPPRAVLKLAGDNGGRCELGQQASAQIDPPKVLLGKVVGIAAAGECEVEFAGELPSGITVGRTLGGLIGTGVLRDVVFLGRPADARPNTTAPIFVLEPGTSFARRASVRYGKISGPLIQVLDGILPGDLVIVTDMSKWAEYPRVRLE